MINLDFKLMSPVQLSLFSDNIPERDINEINVKKKKVSGPLPRIFDEQENPETLLNIPEIDINETKDIEHQLLEYSSPEKVFENDKSLTEEPDSNIYLFDLSETKPLTNEDKAVKIIENEIQQKSDLSSDERIFYLDKVKEIAFGCQKCDLAEKRTQVVFGIGNPNSPIMIIGEGPGEQEDKTGIPFVGKAGQLLDKILESANLIRDRDIYIANVVKCRPPGNRTPLQDEIAACSVFLQKQLELSQAFIILLAGSTALKALIDPNASITRQRGEWIEWKGKWVMPVFHPSYLLRNQSKEVGSPKWLMWQDIKKVKQKFDELQNDKK